MLNQDSINNQIIDLKAKNTTLIGTSMAISTLGGIAGVIYATKKNKSLLGKIGFFFVGNIIVGLASGLVIRPKIVKNNAEITKLEGQQQNLQTIVDAGTNLVNNAINNG